MPASAVRRCRSLTVLVILLVGIVLSPLRGGGDDPHARRLPPGGPTCGYATRREVRDRCGVEGLVPSQRRDGDRRVEHVPHRRSRRRSSTARKPGSPQRAASSKSARTSSSVMDFALRHVGAATSTGTMAAAGLPWRRMRMRFFSCSAWSTSSERWAVASARGVLPLTPPAAPDAPARRGAARAGAWTAAAPRPRRPRAACRPRRSRAPRRAGRPRARRARGP